MPRRTLDDDSWDDGDFGDGDNATISCPYCGHDIYEDAPQCPGCGNYISLEDAPPSRKPWWIILGVLAGLFAVYCWLAR